MSDLSGRTLFWAPRVLSVLFIGFLSLFALDVFGEGFGFWRTLAALAVHLIPSLVLIAALVVAWRWEWVGAAIYGAAGMLYILNLVGRPRPPLAVKLQWMAVIAGPALAIAALFLANWWKHDQLRRRARPV